MDLIFLKGIVNNIRMSLLFLLDVKVKLKQNYFCIYYISVSFLVIYSQNLFPFMESILFLILWNMPFIYVALCTLYDTFKPHGKKHNILRDKLLWSQTDLVDSNPSSALNFTSINPWSSNKNIYFQRLREHKHISFFIAAGTNNHI